MVVIEPIRRNPSVVERHESKATREWAERPQTTRIRGGESPVEIIEAGKIAIDNTGRKFLVGAGQSLGPLLAPTVKVVEFLPGQLGSKNRVVGE